MPPTRPTLRQFRSDGRGATAVEYGLIAALIVIAAIAGMNNFGGGLQNMWDYVENSVSTAR